MGPAYMSPVLELLEEVLFLPVSNLVQSLVLGRLPADKWKVILLNALIIWLRLEKGKKKSQVTPSAVI